MSPKKNEVLEKPAALKNKVLKRPAALKNTVESRQLKYIRIKRSDEKRMVDLVVDGVPSALTASRNKRIYFQRKKVSQRNPEKLLNPKPSPLLDETVFGTVHTKYTCGVFKFLLCKNSTDENALRGIFKNNEYGKSLSEGLTWIDCGCHKGLFAIRALMAGAKYVYGFEAHPGNVKYAKYNLGGWPAKVYLGGVASDDEGYKSGSLYVASSPANTWRHSMTPISGRSALLVRTIYTMSEILDKWSDADAVKLDIEGGEINILKTMKWPERVKTLVFEYSFSHDPDVGNFVKIVRNLKKCFKTVTFPPSALTRPVKNGKYQKLGNKDVIVHCSR